MKLLFEIKVRYMNFKLLMHNVNVSNVFIQDAISFELFNFVLVLHMEHFQFPYYRTINLDTQIEFIWHFQTYCI